MSDLKKNVVYGDESPVAALATVPGNSALTLIRCSGKGSIELVNRVFKSKKINTASGNTVVHGWIFSNKELIDEVLVSVFRSPKSYTGEDSVDISCHGGYTAGKAVLEMLKSAGFRDALPGEFTFRAFINGKMDLTKAESVMEIISAKTETSRRHAVMRLSGSLQNEINEIKNELVQVLSGTEIFLDYSEDEISADADEAAGNLPYQGTAQKALARLKKLYDSWQYERIYQEGVTAVIAGCPNSGKSSLFNSLLKEDRSIVTEIPGTTRDWIEAWVSVKGIPVRLVDTAGLRESSDIIEKSGIERSLKIVNEADIILYLIDGTQGITNEDRDFLKKHETGKIAFFIIWNKTDIAPLSLEKAIPLNMKDEQFTSNKPIAVSAKTGEGLDNLYNTIAMAMHVREELQWNETSLGAERQKKLVGSAYNSLEEALEMARIQQPLDLIAPFLREAVNSLAEITGEVTTSDILEKMFSGFCVGK
jgi:tRNA modification GTPase